MSAVETSLDGQTALVTGAATGVGKAIATELARRGAFVVVSDIDDEGGRRAAADINGSGGRATYVHADVTSTTDLAGVLKAAGVAQDGLNIVVANVMGGGASGSIWETDPETARRTFDIMVFGVYNVIRAFAPALIGTSRSGSPARLLVVGSEHSLGVPPHVFPASVYTVAKYASLGLVDTARRDFADSGVSVTLLAPSWVRTEKLVELIHSSRELAEAIEPNAQNADEVARQAVDGLMKGDYITATNPVTREFALERARQVMASVQTLPVVGPSDDASVHDGTGDTAKCPVAGHM
ncbi:MULTISPECIES: SDR family NAD(P)-dependent oxidoreductase [Streptomyces]|uniref:3-hydroxybutyrate dehydrogenase n=1 Tax=Streptomyces stelliscabiei TaxID=146820 RepID=A0A8I0P2C7_9ACTN|nr:MULTISPECIES: SDR family oxidoreductase [Streptomyces]MBE1594123.1 3-hydroxybutyrate dehydrogenase [Streptomyces stelliscabiei]MDX2520313.1 SDR family NAD(P)-dependent oxidoreductase [Streptomyces stelliscabiei]MDX3274912.1 SDR family NAD(P)-dependent oxidoreductase [Streptomyces scabiei]PIM66662.1 NAD(P)-dependent oxidoreductase [Streptomyces sp. JV178]